MSVSTPLTYRTEADIHRIAADLIPLEHRQEFYRIYPQIDEWASGGFWSNHADCRGDAGFNFLEAAATVYSIYKTLDDPPKRLIYSICETSRSILDKKSLEVFCRISPDAQSYFMKISPRVSRPIAYTYLTLLEETRVVPRLFLDENEKYDTRGWYNNQSKIDLLSKWCREIAKSKPVSICGKSLDFTYPSAEFVDLMGAYVEPAHSLYQNEKTLLMLLRALYDEQRVIEIHHRFKDQGSLLKIEDLNKVLQNWDEYNEHPAAWISEMVNL